MAENMLFWINDEPCRVEGWLNVWGNFFSLVLILVDTQEGSIWSIVLRCDQIYLLITHEIFYTCNSCPRDPYFCVLADTVSDTQSLHLMNHDLLRKILLWTDQDYYP